VAELLSGKRPKLPPTLLPYMAARPRCSTKRGLLVRLGQPETSRQGHFGGRRRCSSGPDGYIAWAAPGGGDLLPALERWFGKPSAVPAASEAEPVTAAS
jgi:hypothetical protein